MCLWSPKVSAGNTWLALSLRSLRQGLSNPELTDMAILASHIALGILSLPAKARITGGTPYPLAFKWFLGI